MHRTLRLAVASLLVLAACTDPSSPVSSRADLVGGVNVSLLDAPSNEELARVAPSFGGFYLAGGETPTVFLGDAADRPAVLGVMQGYLASRGLSDDALRVQPAAYAWRDLATWFDMANAAFDLPGVHMVDLDEARNRVAIAVNHPGAVGLVRATMARLGIPDGALVVEEREEIRNMATLRDVIRPMGGGVQINFPNYVCTLGFNAYDGNQASLITNSHCTTKQGGVESTPYWQPAQSIDGFQVATEVEDPTYTKAKCPRNIRGKVCRSADVSRAAYTAGFTGFQLGLIKKTTGANNNVLTIAGDLTITGEDTRTSFTSGEAMAKIGRTTGWTEGNVTATCVNTGVQGSNIVQLCQTHVAAGVAGGDSGSPVLVSFGNSTNVTLAGILWGGGSTTFVFSPLANIRAEIGNITVR